MAKVMNRPLACLIPVILLSACAATPGEYPSLARRPMERIAGVAPAPQPAIPPVMDQAVIRQLDSLVARVRAADTKFKAREDAVRRAIAAASGATRASDAWSVAMVALTSLDAARSEGMVALADIDAIYAAARIDAASAGEAAAAREAAGAIIANQDRVISELQERLAP